MLLQGCPNEASKSNVTSRSPLQRFLSMWIFVFPSLLSRRWPQRAVTVQGSCTLLPQPQPKPAVWGWVFEWTSRTWAVLWSMSSLQPHHVFSLRTCLSGFHMVENNGKSDFHSYFSFECWRILYNTSSRSGIRGWVCVSKFPKTLMRHRASACSGGVTGRVMGVTEDRWFIAGDIKELAVGRSSASWQALSFEGLIWIGR